MEYLSIPQNMTFFKQWVFFFINVSSKETEFKTDKNQKRALQGPTYVLLCHPVLTLSASRCGNNKDRDQGYKE